MSNEPRKLFEDGIYHVYNRAVKKSLLFKEHSDFSYFFKRICICRKKYGCSIYAVCLMSNHFHMLIGDKGKQLPLIMDAIESAYATFYCRKYEHSGYVFEGTFNSNPANEKSKFIRLFRYILRNPVAAGICESIPDYMWLTPDPNWDRFGIVDFEYVNEIFKGCCRTPYFQFIDSSEDDLWVDDIEKERYDDDVAWEIYKNIKQHVQNTKSENIDIKNEKKHSIIIQACLERGLQYRQLSLFTGYSYYKLRKLKEI